MMLVRIFISPAKSELTRTLMYAVLIICMSSISSGAQEFKFKTPGDLTLPSEYNAQKSDIDKMRFLVHAISDSLDEGQLTHVLDWSRLGLQLSKKNGIDTLKGIFLFDIAKAYTYRYQQYDSAIFYYKQVIPYFPNKIRSYNVYSVREIMERYADLGNKDSSFAYLDKLESLIDTMSIDSRRRISLSLNIATVYQYFGMYRNAINYFDVAVDGNRKRGNLAGLGMSLANLGLLYDEMGDDKKAILYSKEALVYLTSNNMPYMQTAANIAEYFINLKEYDSALVYLQKSDLVVEKVNDVSQKIRNETILARIYVAQRRYNDAKAIMEKNIALLGETGERWLLCSTLINRASLDSTLGNYADAEKHLRLVIDISQQNNFPVFKKIALQNLAGIFSLTGDYKEAFKNHTAFVAFRDSLDNEKSKNDLNDLETQYRTEQKEQQIILLQNENEIKNLELQSSRRSFLFYLMASLMIIIILAIVVYQRNLRTKIQTQKLRAELETQVLRLQMNPHFIFNSLNCIENFIMQNDKRQASDYLGKFSHLIRSILDSSRNEVVPLTKDLEALQWYIELEQLRFRDKFTYKATIDPALSDGDYRVPSLLIQPHVENAIVHGLAHSEAPNLTLTVSVSLKDDLIHYIIEDNGIGREKAREYNAQNKPRHNSLGLKIAEERIRMFNNKMHEHAVRFSDLYDELNKPIGTRVEILIKTV